MRYNAHDINTSNVLWFYPSDPHYPAVDAIHSVSDRSGSRDSRCISEYIFAYTGPTSMPLRVSSARPNANPVAANSSAALLSSHLSSDLMAAVAAVNLSGGIVCKDPRKPLMRSLRCALAYISIPASICSSVQFLLYKIRFSSDLRRYPSPPRMLLCYLIQIAGLSNPADLALSDHQS